jgi:hypothetical protein
MVDQLNSISVIESADKSIPCSHLKFQQFNYNQSTIELFGDSLIINSTIQLFIKPTYLRKKFDEVHGTNPQKIERHILVVIPCFYSSSCIWNLCALGISNADPPLPGDLFCKGVGHHVIFHTTVVYPDAATISQRQSVLRIWDLVIKEQKSQPLRLASYRISFFSLYFTSSNSASVTVSPPPPCCWPPAACCPPCCCCCCCCPPAC